MEEWEKQQKDWNYSKEKMKALAANRERAIRAQTPIHSKAPTKEFYENYDKVKWNVVR